MEEFIQNGGLCHLAEAIFSCLPDKELVKCLQVSKLWHSFLTNSDFWKKRWIKKLDWIIANKYQSMRLSDNDYCPCPYLSESLFETLNLIQDGKSFVTT